MPNMRLVTLLGFTLVTAINAAPIFDGANLNSTIWTPEHVLQPDEVILYGEGRSK